MSQEIDKTKPAYVRFKVVNGVPYYVLCIDPLVDTHVFSFELDGWTDEVTMSNMHTHLETLLVGAFTVGFKQVIEIVADQTIDDRIMYIVKKYTEKDGVQCKVPVYLFTDNDKMPKWGFLGFWFRTQSEALIAVNSLFSFAEVESTEKSTEVKVPPVKVKKVRPPSETRKLEKEIIETVKKKRLASIALAEGNSDPYLRRSHANDVRAYELTLKTLKARFPKWVFTWER